MMNTIGGFNLITDNGDDDVLIQYNLLLKYVDEDAFNFVSFDLLAEQFNRSSQRRSNTQQ